MRAHSLGAQDGSRDPDHASAQEAHRAVFGQRRKEAKVEVRYDGPRRGDLRDEEEEQDQDIQEAKEGLCRQLHGQFGIEDSTQR